MNTLVIWQEGCKQHQDNKPLFVGAIQPESDGLKQHEMSLTHCFTARLSGRLHSWRVAVSQSVCLEPNVFNTAEGVSASPCAVMAGSTTGVYCRSNSKKETKGPGLF